jgi:hypothetical protein
MSNPHKPIGSSWAILSLPIAIVFVLLAVWIKSWALSSGFAQAIPVLLVLLGAVIIALLRWWKPTD